MAYCLPLSFAYHESSQSWRELLGQLKRLGLSGSTKSWSLMTDRSASGSLCRKNMARSPSNVCWVHKTANILDKMPKLKGFKRSQR
jgi:transposase-like protein